jgi:D-Tyr-tRNAtyr deacylase
MKTPAVYAIVCGPTGKKYIGSSRTPWLRRAVHLYWLKNYWRWGCSNVFFGSLAIKHDVEQYGVEAFYMEIIKSCPGATNEELKEIEAKILIKSEDELYNKWYKGESHGSHDAKHFLEIEPEYAKMHEYYVKQKLVLQKVERKYEFTVKRRVAKLKYYSEMMNNGEITDELHRGVRLLIGTTHAKIKKKVDWMREQDRDLRALLKLRTRELREKYSNSEVPLY